MGVERSVTRWYIQRQFIHNEIALLEAQLGQASQGQAPANGSDDVVQVTDLELQLDKARKKLLLLGPCPRPMMG